jgi:acyl-CoA thioester hydrolase
MSSVFENEIRVRYAETDQMGFVYYGNYAEFLEVARTELIRTLGLTYKDLELRGIHLPVVNLNIAYRYPAKYDDLLLLKTRVKGEITKKILFETEIFNQENQLICRANVELIFVNKRSGKVMNCPEDLNIKLSQFR